MIGVGVLGLYIGFVLGMTVTILLIDSKNK